MPGVEQEDHRFSGRGTDNQLTVEPPPGKGRGSVNCDVHDVCVVSDCFAMPESEPDESSADVKPSGQPASSSASPSASRVSLREQHGEDDRVPAHQCHSDLRRESSAQVNQAGTSASTTGAPDWPLGGRADDQAAGQDATSGAGDRAEKASTTQQGDPGGVHGDEAGNETVSQLEDRCLKHLYEVTEPARKDAVGFGRHADMTYAQVLKERPQYCDWVKKTYLKTPECCDRLKRLGRWLTRHHDTEIETEVKKPTTSKVLKIKTKDASRSRLPSLRYLQPGRGDREAGGRGEGSPGGDPGVQTNRSGPEEGRREIMAPLLNEISMRTGGVVRTSVAIAGLMRMP